MLDFHEADGALHRVGEILNKRPLAVRMSPEGSYHVICPADLLLGQASEAPQDFREPEVEEQDITALKMLNAQEEIAREWWVEWMRSSFTELIPRKKWKVKTRNLRVGDVCLLKYASRFSRPAYKLCRVKEVLPDDEGTVRSCKVQMRPKRQGEDSEPSYRPKELSTIIVGVQRLVVILAVEEQEEDSKQDTEEVQKSRPGTNPSSGGGQQEKDSDAGSEEERGVGRGVLEADTGELAGPVRKPLISSSREEGQLEEDGSTPGGVQASPRRGGQRQEAEVCREEQCSEEERRIPPTRTCRKVINYKD